MSNHIIPQNLSSGSPDLQALLLRLTLAEINAYPLTAQGDWLLTLSDIEGLSLEDGWALVYAARLLADNPDPDFWQRKLV
jgi:hypothetical protein